MWPPTELNQISTMNEFKVAAIKWPQRGRLMYSHSGMLRFSQSNIKLQKGHVFFKMLLKQISG